jgi:RNA polymerase sigma-70 factor, ECF subfamily
MSAFMDPMQEQQVVSGLREGSVDAWRALYDAYCRQIWHAVARMMGPGDPDIADVVQETFMAAARSAGRYDPERGTLWLWLYGIARNHVALHFRKQGRPDRSRPTSERDEENNRRIVEWLEGRERAPAEVLQSAEVAALVRIALNKLPVDYGAVLTAKYFDGASVEQIAGAERCSATAVRSRLARARQAFRQVFLRSRDNSTTG